MVLRIEDTDVARSEARFESQLLDDLKWMGLDWDEGPDLGGPYGPYRQSDRLATYREHAERLVSEGKAYLCFCSQEELESDRAEKLASQQPPVYSGKCRALDPAEAQGRSASGEAAAIRLRIPEHPIRFHDIVAWCSGVFQRGGQRSHHRALQRMPVYNYVVVVDDGLMKITHVIRGDDHLSNTPKQVALYEALGWPVPQFAHLSTILGSDRERLSKRHGATSIANFREMGVLPEALMNYLALLGWAPSGGTREIFSPEELKKEFSLGRVTPSPAVFDIEKLYWLNRHYIKESEPERIEKLAEPYFIPAGLLPGSPDERTRAWFGKVVALLAPSVDKLEQLPERAALIFRYDAAVAASAPDNAEVLAAPKTAEVLAAFARLAEDGSAPTLSPTDGDKGGAPSNSEAMTPERFKAIMNEVKAKTGAKGKELFHPVRVALTGSHSGPGLTS